LLRQQLVTAQENISSTSSAVRLDDTNHNQYMLPVIPKDDSDGEMDINVSMIPREEGEVSNIFNTLISHSKDSHEGERVP
jgi:hypothetical protein